MMSTDSAPVARGNIVFTTILIVANLLMLVAGICTVPANFRKITGREGILDESVTKAFSTKERPDLEDFLWYTQDVYYDGIPADAILIEDFTAITGGWKGIIYFDPENQMDLKGMNFVNVTISGSRQDLNVTLDWYITYLPDEELSFDDTAEDMVFIGSWDGGLAATAKTTIYFPQFYELNNKQYAIGHMDALNAIPAYMALVRP